MKKFIFTSLICLLSVSSIFSQSLKWETDEEKSYKVPVGACSWNDIMLSDFSGIVIENSSDVILNAQATEELAQILESQEGTRYEMEAYFAAWDEESLLQLPWFNVFAMTMEAKYQQPIATQYYGCNREYDCGCELIPIAMPYFKVYRITPDGKRTLIGEITEKPEVSFEDDVLKFIKR